MKRKATLTLVLTLLICGVALAQAGNVSSAVVINEVKVIKKGANYDCIATGSMTLGTNDTFTSYRLAFIDPNNNEKAPFVTFTPPKAGKTENYDAVITTQVLGDWKFEASLQYKDKDDNPGSVAKTKKFTVP